MAQIYVRKLYADDKEFKGRKYIEYKIYTTAGTYYTSQKKFEDFVEEGAALEVEAEPTSNPKYFKLKSCKLIANPKGSQTQPAGQGQAVSPPPKPLPALTPELQVEFMDKAFKAMDLKHGVNWDPLVYGELVAELVREYFSVWISERIATEQKARFGR